MKTKRIILILGIVLAAGCVFSYIRTESAESYSEFSGSQSGSHNSIAYKSIYKFRRSAGNTVVYEVENKGSENIVIKLGRLEKIVKPHESGVLSYELKKKSETAILQAYPEDAGKSNDVDISYKIEQN